MARNPTLLCASMPFGYGPASKLIAIARCLRGRVRLVFVGRGVALELIRRVPDVFDEIVPLAPSDPAARAHFVAADGVLSLMDRDAGAAAGAADKPLFVLDSLLWMRAGIPAAFLRARRYWAQAFPGLSAEDHQPRPQVIGPLLGPATPPGEPRDGLVVHLGGSAAPDDRRAVYRRYARWALGGVVEAGLVERFGRVLVLGGETALSGLEGVCEDSRIQLSGVTPDEARARMAQARAVLTSPGLTATLECFRAGVPTWFLPPQNYSQWLILTTLRTRGLCESAFHWEDLPGVPALRRGMEVSEHAPIVRATLERLSHAERLSGHLVDSLREVGRTPEQVTVTQRAFFDTLGHPALADVVDQLQRALRDP